MNTHPENHTATETGRGAGIFLVTSLIFLALASLMMVGRPSYLLTPVLTGHGLSWLMLILFGCGLSGVFGLVYRAFPKAFGVPLYSEKFVMLHYGFHMAGTLLALVSVIRPDFPRSEMGATFLACGAVVFIINISLTLRSPSQPDAGRAYLAASMVWLLIMSFLGLPFKAEAPISYLGGTDWSAAWLVFSFAGVVLNTLMGLATRIMPATLGLPPARTGTIWYALIFTNAGLAWMFPAITFRSMGFLFLCAALYLLGAFLYLAGFLGQLNRLPSRVLPWDTKMLVASFSLLPVAAGLLLLSAWERMAPTPPTAEGIPVPEPTGPLPVEFMPVDGALALTAALAIMVPTIAALMFQFIRMERGTPETAPPRDRLSELILLASYFNYATGVLLVVPAAWAGIEKIVSLGTLFLLVGALGFLGNYFFSAPRRPLAGTQAVEA